VAGRVGVARYFARKLFTYTLTFVIAVTIDWAIPRFMPGNPVQSLVSRIALRPEASEAMTSYYMKAFNLNDPWWKEYLAFWVALFHGDLGRSIMQFPTPVSTLIMRALPYTLALLIPAILLSWYAGNKVGAVAARRKVLDNSVLPVGYLLTATPYMWLGILLAWVLSSTYRLFPIAGGYDFGLTASWSWPFVESLLYHWFLPFLSLFLVMFGGWAIGMRNMIIYELEADYAHYLEGLGVPNRLIRKYAFRNAMLPQITGLALVLGAVVAGNLVTEIVFSYPGLGTLVLNAIQNQDYFLIQGIFLFIIVGVLLMNFIVDVVYLVIDPRTRLGMHGGRP
jgi:peptide/nickel transport system permease protein